MSKGASVQLVFGFGKLFGNLIYNEAISIILEYAILLTVAMTAFVKFVLHSIDLQSEDPWENKSMYVESTFSINLLNSILNISKVYALFGPGNESYATYTLFDLYRHNVQNSYIADFRSTSDVSRHKKIPKEFI